MDKYLLTDNNYNFFTYSKRSHFEAFLKPAEFFHLNIDELHPKFYQDLFIYNFLLINIPKGSKILEIGGGNSRIFKYLNTYYDITILDKFKGNGNGPQNIPSYLKNNVVPDYIGNFNKELEDNSFDCILSISVLEHLPNDQSTLDNVLKDINRLLRKNAYSIHAIDCILKREDHYWKHPIVDMMLNLQTEQTIPKAIEISQDDDFYYLSEKAYDKSWKIHTKKSYCTHGKAFSVNIIYKKT